MAAETSSNFDVPHQVLLVFGAVWLELILRDGPNIVENLNNESHFVGKLDSVSTEK